MALIPSSRYPAQTDTGDPAYPHGKARSSGSYQDGTGTPLNKDWLNDLWGFLQALLDAAEITPSGDPDEVGASQYLDAVQVVATGATLQRNITRALTLRALDLNGTTPISNTYLGAVKVAAGVTLVAKGSTNGVFSVRDTPLIGPSSVTVTGINQLLKLIVGGGRILAIGDGTTRNAYSTNSGALWTAGGSSGLTLVPTDGVWDGEQFVISTPDGHAAHSTNGVTWSTATGGSDILDVLTALQDGGLAALASGTVVAAGDTASDKAFALSNDHGQTWTPGGTIPSSSDYAGSGYVAGNGGTEVYWMGKVDGVDRLDLFVSTNGTTWTKRSEVPGFAGLPGPKLYMCQDTGLLLAAQLVSGTRMVSASDDRGYTWSGIANYNVTDAAALAVANGRIFATIGARLFASDSL